MSTNKTWWERFNTWLYLMSLQEFIFLVIACSIYLFIAVLMVLYIINGGGPDAIDAHARPYGYAYPELVHDHEWWGP